MRGDPWSSQMKFWRGPGNVGKRKQLEQEIKALKKKLGRRGIALTTAKQPKAQPKPPLKISDEFLAWSGTKKDRVRDLSERIYQAAQPMPGVIPAGRKTLAMDENIKRSSEAAAIALDQQIVFAAGWASGGYGGNYGAFAEGQAFLGYPYRNHGLNC